MPNAGMMACMNKNAVGRPPLDDSERAKPRAIRLTDEHYAKLKRLGMDWLRKQIEKAREKKDEH